MKNTLKYILPVISVAVSLFACKKDGEFTYANKSEATPKGLTLSTNKLTLSTDNKSDSVLTIKWGKSNFGYDAGITYTVQFSHKDSAFRNTQDVAASNATSVKLTGAMLNDIAIALKYATDKADTLLVRVVSMIGSPKANYNAISDVVKLVVTPFSGWPNKITFPALYVPGNYQGWEPADAVIAKMYSVNSNKIYEGCVFLPNPESGFLFTPAPDWSNKYAMTGTPTVTTSDGITNVSGTLAYNNGDNFSFAGAAGCYFFSLNTEAGTWTAKLANYSIIGSAVGGWDASNDVMLEFDPTTQTFFKIVNMNVGEWKFRMNKRWEGGDFPGNQTISEAGTYKVLLDLRIPSAPVWKIIKQ